MKRFAISVAVLSTLIISILFAASPALAQDKGADPQSATAAQPSKKDVKKDQKKEEKKEEPKKEEAKEEKKPGMNADTFSGLKFRLIGPAVASGRVMSIAVNPKNKVEY